ncbi:MAG: type I methionyl aminopeptidase [Bacteroidetes bacterium]|jgi:methionyl aminopeptidase|nr:type I methionyl aminopeptidase [Bacteroidota bacterium]
MSVNTEQELEYLKQVSDVVAITLREMCDYAKPGMSTKHLDEYGYKIMQQHGAIPAPYKLYGFPGWTCISVNHVVAHGIPSEKVILQEGDLVNIDVSAELNGYFADNGSSFILGKDIYGLGPLVEVSKMALQHAIEQLTDGVKISVIGGVIEAEARKNGFRVIRNLVGHGVGKSLHEAPHEIPCFCDHSNADCFRKNSVVAIETFISTHARYVDQLNDGWTLFAPSGSFVAQQEHTLLITEDKPVILTAKNEIF